MAALKLNVSPDQLQQLNDLVREIREDPQRVERVRALLRLLGDRWSPLLLLVLSAGRMRHAALRRALSSLTDEKAISQRMLTLKLREFERHGLIDRRASSDVPPMVDYALTCDGRELARHARALIEWVKAPKDDPEEPQSLSRRA